ncbi:MAG: hypothetical protein E7559_01030 [Ruminococcaceae bacterium]|nr:hypothetical protein [Oscillospiraceae bacterium]
MELRQSIAPHFRLEETARSIMLSQLAAVAVLLSVAIAMYGFRALIMGFAGACGAVLAELLWRYLAKQQPTITDLSAVVTGLMIALLLPANASVLLPLFAAVFAIGVVKLPFGGFGRSPFNCAAAGYCFIALVCAGGRSLYNRALLDIADREIFDRLPQQFFTYVKGYITPFANITTSETELCGLLSPPVLLRAGVDPDLSAVELLFGGMRGPMGCTIGLLLIACAVWLYLRRSIAWRASAAYCAAVIVISFFAPWKSVSRTMSPVYDLLSGAVLFAAVFIFGDIFTAPHTRSGQLIYGICGGILTIVLRRTGSIDCGEIFAALMMNACASPIDRLVWSLRQRGYSLSGEWARYKQRLRKALRSQRGSFADIDLDELDFSGKGGWDDDDKE